MYSSVLLTVFPLLLSFVSGQLSNPSAVGPLTSFSSKQEKKVCDVTDYGAVADGETDLGPPLTAAFSACSGGGVVNVPTGTFAMATFVNLAGTNAWAFNLDGIIIRTGNIGSGNMIAIGPATDFEFTSQNGQGAIQGYGYQFLEQGTYGPRELRLTDVTSFSVHDIALVDSPAFHLVMDTCTDGEVYNTIIRGANEGGLDGIDVWGSNIWIHDVEVTNKDECVTVKNPSDHIQVEDIYCNWSGGCAMGSLGTDTDISNILYRNIYTQTSNQAYMFKSNGGNGTVSTVTLENFINHNNAYTFWLNAYWSSISTIAGGGILYTDITVSNWTGDCADGIQRAPLYVECPTGVPCTDITITDFSVWTDAGDSEYYKCSDAYGEGYCLNSASPTPQSVTTTSTVTVAPSGWQAPTMPSDINSGLGVTTSIAIPTVPNSFFPGATPATSRNYNPATAA